MSSFLRGSLVVLFAALAALSAGCSVVREADIVDHQLCEGSRPTVFCPIGIDDEGETIVFFSGIDGYTPDVCRGRRLRVNMTVDPVESRTSSTLIEILEDDATNDGFSLYARPSDFDDGVVPFDLVCRDADECSGFYSDDSVAVMTFECRDGAPIAVEILR